MLDRIDDDKLNAIFFTQGGRQDVQNFLDDDAPGLEGKGFGHDNVWDNDANYMRENKLDDRVKYAKIFWTWAYRSSNGESNTHITTVFPGVYSSLRAARELQQALVFLHFRPSRIFVYIGKLSHQVVFALPAALTRLVFSYGPNRQGERRVCNYGSLRWSNNLLATANIQLRWQHQKCR